MKHLLTCGSLLLLACGHETETGNKDAETVSADTTVTADPTQPEQRDTLIELKEKNQVTDYAEFFLQAPVFKDREKMNRESGDMHYYEVLDIENGYAEVTGAYEGKHTFAIWHMANGHDLVGYTQSSCGPVCDYVFNFYEVAGNDEREVSLDVLPFDKINAHREKMEAEMQMTGDMDESVPTQLKMILPQKGTTLNLYLSMNSNELEFPLMTLKWNKSVFVVDEVFDEVMTAVQR